MPADPLFERLAQQEPLDEGRDGGTDGDADRPESGHRGVSSDLGGERVPETGGKVGPPGDAPGRGDEAVGLKHHEHGHHDQDDQPDHGDLCRAADVAEGVERILGDP